ncbi:uncharacterized protein VTP21DRAFT_9769 [Calcarisporiella thermophila]|uniref:uncharacterized protein n=1 Tax=Calcarisporiella thermophila TaxID=911321 RepID=UPI00374241CD
MIPRLSLLRGLIPPLLLCIILHFHFAFGALRRGGLTGSALKDALPPVRNIEPNSTLTSDGKVKIKLGVLLPFKTNNAYFRPHISTAFSAIQLALNDIQNEQVIPGAQVSIIPMTTSLNDQATAMLTSLSVLEQGVTGVIGDFKSDSTAVSAMLSSHYGVPQCSFSAMSDDLRKPQFSHLFRTIPTATTKIRSILGFIKSNGWTRFGILYEDDPLDNLMANYMAQAAAKEGLEVACDEIFHVNGKEDTDLALKRIKKHDVRILVLLSKFESLVKTIDTIKERGLFDRDHVFITTRTYNFRDIAMKKWNDPTAYDGMILVQSWQRREDSPAYLSFINKWKTMNHTEYPDLDPTQLIYYEAYAYTCAMAMAHGFNSLVSNITAQNASVSRQEALIQLATGKLGSKLTPSAFNTGYVGPSGPASFDERGDPLFWSQAFYYVKDGQPIMFANMDSEKNMTFSAKPVFRSGALTVSDTASTTPANPRLPDPGVIIIIALNGLGMFISLVFIAIVIWKKDNPIIRTGSPLFQCIQLLGIILLFAGGLFFIGLPSMSCCRLRPAAWSLGMLLLVETMIAKNYRLYRIFNNPYAMRKGIPDWQLLKLSGVLTAIGLVILVLSLALDRPALVANPMGNQQHELACLSSPITNILRIILVVYILIQMVIALMIVFRVRNIRKSWNETRQAGLAICNIFFLFLVGVFARLIPSYGFIAQFYILQAVSFFSGVIALVFLFVPRIVALFSRKHKDKAMSAMTISMVNSSFSGEHPDSILLRGLDVHRLTGAGAFGMLDSKHRELTTFAGVLPVSVRHKLWKALSVWNIARVLVIPELRYFILIDSDTDRASTYWYKRARPIHKQPDAFLISLECKGAHHFLFQVESEERMNDWVSLFNQPARAPTMFQMQRLPTLPIPQSFVPAPPSSRGDTI